MTAITIDTGRVSGVPATDAGDVTVYRGIPFASPPTGSRRWTAPAPAAGWTGVRVADRPGPSCPQPKAMIWPLQGPQDEDCLHLNVWTPGPAGDALPVMVWLHGGGFITGAGSSILYDADGLARHGAVVVTINYRLGPFGFLAHPELTAETPYGASGNYGLLDQVAALRWVRANIAAFGGDPACVTLFGESAGAASVLRLMASPLARGLFHRAVAQSGNVRGPARTLAEMEKSGLDVAGRLGLDREAGLSGLRNVPATELLKAARPASGLFGPGVRYQPIVDGHALTEDPESSFEAGRFANVPLLTGTNEDEGTIFVPETGVTTVHGFRSMVRARFGDFAGEVLAFYPAGSDDEVAGALNRMITDAAFVAPGRQVARVVAGAGSPVYAYHLTRVSPGAARSGRGAFHASDVSYVFNRTANTLFYDDADRDLGRMMSAAWVRFAAGGDPNGAGLPAWPRYEADERHLVLGDDVTVDAGLRRDACDLFDRIHQAVGRETAGKGR